MSERVKGDVQGAVRVSQLIASNARRESSKQRNQRRGGGERRKEEARGNILIVTVRNSLA